MSEFFRKYWFVCLIAVGLIAGLGYYIADLNKDNVSGKKVDGQDVVASTSLGDVTSQQIFDRYQNFNSTLLYNMYQTAVVDQSVDATTEMKAQAKTMTRNIKANMGSDTTGKTRFSVLSELASYGFEGEDSLENYCLFAMKARALDKAYILEHYDELKDSIETNPRTVSIITLEVPNAEILTKEKQAKKDSIDKALENGDSFEDTARAFSEDTNTAHKAGFYGYLDSATTDLDSEVVKAALDLKPGEYSEWITSKDSKSGMFILTRIYVNDTDPKAMLESTDTSVSDGIVSAFVNANKNLEGKAVAQAAEKLNITFDNDSVKEKIEKAIAAATGADTEEKAEDKKEDKESSDSNKSEDKEESKDNSEDKKEDEQKEGESNEANE